MILVLGFFAGLFGGLGIGAIVPIFSLLTNQATPEVDKISEIIQKVFSVLQLPFNLPFLVTFIAILFVLKAIIQFSAKYVNTKIAAEYESSLRNKLFSATLQATWPYLLNQKVGYLERIVMNDIYRSADIIFRIANIILLGTSLAMYAVVALGISASVTLLTIGFGAGLFWIFKPFFYKTRKISENMAVTEKVVTHQVSESIIGAKVIKTLSVEDTLIRRARKHFEQLKEARIKTGLYQYAVGNTYEPVGFIFIAVLFIIYHKLPGFSVISFAAVIYLVQKMFAYAQSLQGNAYQISEAIPFLQVVADFHSLTTKNKELTNGSAAFKFNDRLDFKNVKFSYNPETEILSGMTFSIKKGQMIGLVGPSGVGKTTVADLLLRLFYPTSGEILLDGRDVSQIDIKDWRKNVGYVSQDMFLLNDTIQNNIRFFDNEVSEKDIIEAAKAANIYDFVQELPKKFGTVIGERGIKLSVGQRQRVVLARALVKNPRLLVLDEATSSLDSQSESLVQKAIENLKGRVTVLAIAHRLSTIMNADKLLVLDGGKIIEEGLPAELLKDKDSHFYKMYDINNNNLN